MKRINSNSLTIIEPSTEDEFKKYFQLRWEILRAPWNQPAGSEKDEFEDKAIHRIALINEKVVGVGRLHFIDDNTAQIRYMAVKEDLERQGIGKAILKSLEQAVINKNIKTISLQAREKAVGFYKKQGYKTIKPSHLLFDEIQHFAMEKHLTSTAKMNQIPLPGNTS